jgi:hypothetical protein
MGTNQVIYIKAIKVILNNTIWGHLLAIYPLSVPSLSHGILCAKIEWRLQQYQVIEPVFIVIEYPNLIVLEKSAHHCRKKGKESSRAAGNIH